MRILIIEDEARIARRLERMTTNFFEHNLVSIIVCDSLGKGLSYIAKNTIDVLLLDLNLNGENGFNVLEKVVAGAFHTIIVSANTDKAILAYQYGVIDFVAKPFDQERLDLAFTRLKTVAVKTENEMKFLAVKKSGGVSLIAIDDLVYIKGAGIYSELHLKNGKQELHDKSLEKLEQLLSHSFDRVHKSYLVPLNQAERIMVQSGSKYSLLLKNGELIPVGRSRYKELKHKMI